MDASREPRTYRLRRQTLVLVALLTFALIAAAAIALSFIVSALERTTWEARQIEAASHASSFISGVFNEIRLFVNTASAAQTYAHFDYIIGDLSSQYPAIAEFVAVNQDGIILLVRSEDELILANQFTVQDSTWYIRAREGTPYLSDLLFSPQNTPYLIYSSLLASGDVLGIRLDMSVFAEAVALIRYGDTGMAYLVDSQGRLLAHPDFSYVAANIQLSNRPELMSALARGRAAWSGTYQNFLGDSVLGTSVPIPNTNWLVFTEVDQSEAFSRGRLFLMLLVIGGTIGGEILILSIDQLLWRFVFVPLNNLSDGTLEMIRGNLKYRVLVTRDDEIGQLTRQFNVMAEKLREGREILSNQAEELRQARDEAIAASQAAQDNAHLKSEFLSTMSHELRTPLNAIEGFTSIMLHGMGVEVNPKVHGMLERISANSKRLLQLINSFLDLSRIEAGRTEITVMPLSPLKLIERWRTQVEPQAAAKQLKLEMWIAPNFVSPLYGDEDALTKIASNLLSNAVKFTAQGTVTLRLLWNETTWAIQVQDTEIGIPVHARDYIFEEFRQVDSSSKRLYGGTGLGLSIVQKLVRVLNGSITLDSTLGEGSTFTITLPVIGMDVTRQGVGRKSETPPADVTVKTLLVTESTRNQEDSHAEDTPRSAR